MGMLIWLGNVGMGLSEVSVDDTGFIPIVDDADIAVPNDEANITIQTD